MLKSLPLFYRALRAGQGPMVTQEPSQGKQPDFRFFPCVLHTEEEGLGLGFRTFRPVFPKPLRGISWGI